MKKLSVLLILMSILFYSCIENKKPVGSYLSSISDTTGYYSARNMNGLGPFQIGITTYQSTLEEHFSGLTLLTYDTTKTFNGDLIFSPVYLACNYIKAIGLYEYYISDIEIRSLLLTFYHDTLIRLDCNQNDKIDEGFTLKYGSGKRTAFTTWKTPMGETDKRPSNDAIRSGKAQIIRIFDQIIWENENVKATSYTNIKYNVGKGASGAEYSSYDFSILTKDKNLINEIEKCDSTNRSNYNRRLDIREKDRLKNL